ncbi:MAG: hypothetical protein N2255_07230 [Kiritimatiellae bacterium]|nr:hypothetical protein [Kiritimatiellia bacterium]
MHKQVWMLAALIVFGPVVWLHADVITNEYSNPPTATVSANLSDPAPDQLAVRVLSGQVAFTGNNTYSGGTVVENTGAFDTSTSGSPLGTGEVLVKGGGTLVLNGSSLSAGGTRTIPNALRLKAGSKVQRIGGPWNNETFFAVNGDVYLGGSVDIEVGSASQTYPYLVLNGIVQNEGANVGSLVVWGKGNNVSEQRYLRLSGNNTYTGGTILKSPQGFVQVYHNNGLGSGNVTVESGARLWLQAVTIANNVTFANGSDVYTSGGDAAMNGTLTLNGTVNLRCGTDNVNRFLNLNQSGGKITGSGGLVYYTAYWNGNNSFRVYGNNDYTGSTIVSNGAQVTAYHPNAFGTTANIVYVGSGVSARTARLIIDSSLTTGLNVNKTIRCGPDGWFNQAKGTTVNNTLILAGGIYRFDSPELGSGDATHSGQIILQSGTTSTITRRYLRTNWLQTGTMTGSGALILTGYSSYDGYLRLRGNNSAFSGAVTLSSAGGYSGRNFVGADNALGTGNVLLQGTLSTTTLLTLEANVSMANIFRGVGRINTTGYKLTVTGGFAPGVTTGKRIDTIDTTGGTLDFRGTYYWDYTNGVADVVVASTLVFGNPGGAANLEITWLGVGKPLTGDFTLFTYTGTDPVITSPWTINGPLPFYRCRVWVDGAPVRQVKVSIQEPPKGSLIMLR